MATTTVTRRYSIISKVQYYHAARLLGLARVDFVQQMRQVGAILGPVVYTFVRSC